MQVASNAGIARRRLRTCDMLGRHRESFAWSVMKVSWQDDERKVPKVLQAVTSRSAITIPIPIPCSSTNPYRRFRPTLSHPPSSHRTARRLHRIHTRRPQPSYQHLNQPKDLQSHDRPRENGHLQHWSKTETVRGYLPDTLRQGTAHMRQTT